MTVGTELCRATFAWTGVETSLSCGFPADKKADVFAFFRTVAGVQSTLTQGVNYDVTLSSGTKLVTVTPIAMPAAAGTIVVLRDTPALVNEVLVDGQDFSNEVIQQLHDRAAMRDAELLLALARALRLADTAEIGAGSYDLQNTGLANLAPGVASTDAATVGQIQAILAASGNVPSPVLGNVGRALLATAPGVFGWGQLGLTALVDGLLTADVAGRAKTAALYTQPAMVSELAAPAGGRLTLASNTPVMTATVAAATAVYYAPYLHDALPIYNGSVWTWRQFGQMTLTLDATGHVANSNYDVFAFDDNGTLRIGAGPAWTSDTARGTGAGTTELARLAGRTTNAVAISLRNNGVAYAGVGVGRALYLGSIRTGAAGQTNFSFGASASGGTAAIFGLWNAYNRVDVATSISDTGTGYTYASNTIRAPRGGTGMRANFLQGLAEDGVSFRGSTAASSAAAGNYFRAGIGLDSTTAPAAGTGMQLGQFGNLTHAIATAFEAPALLGWHYLTLLESSDTVTTSSFNANAALLNYTTCSFKGRF